MKKTSQTIDVGGGQKTHKTTDHKSIMNNIIYDYNYF